MTQEEAIQATKQWLEVRNEARTALIKAARDAHPINARVVGEPLEDWPSNTIRKLYQFPSDLSERRLLGLIEGDIT